MAFGSTPVLDDFNRSDSSTSIGGDWSIFGRTPGGYDLGITSNQAYNPDTEWNSIYYDAAEYGPDCEVYMTLATLPPQDKTTVLYLRLKDVTAEAWNFDGYGISAYRWDNGGTDTMSIRLRRVDNNVTTNLGAGGVGIANPINGFKFGLSAVGTTLKGYYDNGSGWVEAMSLTDATYSNAGYFGFYFDTEATARYDNFGGGTLGGVAIKAMHNQRLRRR